VRIRLKADRTRARLAPALWEGFWHTVQAANGWHALVAADVPVWEVYGGLGALPNAREALRVPHNPHIHWAWIENAGHYLPLERAADVARIVCHAMRRTRSGA